MNWESVFGKHKINLTYISQNPPIFTFLHQTAKSGRCGRFTVIGSFYLIALSNFRERLKSVYSKSSFTDFLMN